MKSIKKGDKGDKVKQIQKALKITADGDFGPATELSVMKFQGQNSLGIDGVVGPNTWAKLIITKSKYTREQIKSAVLSKGYDWFEEGDYNLNIVGVRNSDTKGKVTNKFDDLITLSYKIDGEWVLDCYDCTTDPGSHWAKNIMNSKGVAILKPGQYLKSHKLRLHGGKYLALGQQNPLTVYRDNNRDDNYDLNESKTDTGLFGINIHRASKYEGKKSTNVDKWSAGCQVIAANDDWHAFLDVCQVARDKWSNNFTYTLIESKDIK